MIQPNWILQRTRLSQNRIALIDLHSKEQWTYQKLESEIAKWTTFFATKKFKKGDRVAILSRNKIELFPIIFACGIAGLMYVPINWRLSKQEIEELLKDSEA